MLHRLLMEPMPNQPLGIKHDALRLLLSIVARFVPHQNTPLGGKRHYRRCEILVLGVRDHLHRPIVEECNDRIGGAQVDAHHPRLGGEGVDEGREHGTQGYRDDASRDEQLGVRHLRRLSRSLRPIHCCLIPLLRLLSCRRGGTSYCLPSHLVCFTSQILLLLPPF
mmetsp:Transcript_46649/g.116877  ORF Transcript_46649/g.116877 Transcript_46649/m.116877 type:complete len:166 (-) Transcript_46649:148-645(-)